MEFDSQCVLSAAGCSFLRQRASTLGALPFPELGNQLWAPLHPSPCPSTLARGIFVCLAFQKRAPAAPNSSGLASVTELMPASLLCLLRTNCMSALEANLKRWEELGEQQAGGEAGVGAE